MKVMFLMFVVFSKWSILWCSIGWPFLVTPYIMTRTIISANIKPVLTFWPQKKLSKWYIERVEKVTFWWKWTFKEILQCCLMLQRLNIWLIQVKWFWLCHFMCWVGTTWVKSNTYIYTVIFKDNPRCLDFVDLTGLFHYGLCFLNSTLGE